MAMRGILNLHFLTILTNTIEETIKFAKKMGILPQSVKCPNCKRNLEKPYILIDLKVTAKILDTSVIKRNVEVEEKEMLYLLKLEHGSANLISL